VDWTVYGALIAGFLAFCGGIAFLAVRILDVWRSVKRLRRHAAKELDRLTELGDRAAEKAEWDADALTKSLSRLRVSLARLAVLTAAFDEATAVVTRFTAVYARK
jgi:3-hydroxyacyl-CoA dehydrogenase